MKDGLIHSHVLTSFLWTARVEYLIAVLSVGPGSAVGVRTPEKSLLVSAPGTETEQTCTQVVPG